METYLLAALRSAVFIIIALIIYKAAGYILKKSSNLSIAQSLSVGANKTYFSIIKRIVRFIYALVTVLILLQINGINVSAMLAGIGIAGTIIGFAAQDALKDVIRGISIIAENYYKVGDVVKIGDTLGTVESRGIKTTKIHDIATDNTLVIANRNIDMVEIISTTVLIQIPMPYELEIEKAEAAMRDIVTAAESLERIEKAEYKGVTELADSSIKYMLKIMCKPANRIQARRDALRAVMLVFDRHGISVPYNQLDIHNK